jgi:branched-chain amino acid transport system substrate-binding protein
MKKIIVVVIGVLLLGGVVLGILWRLGRISLGPSAAPFYIAVVGPKRGADKLSGQAMLKGIQLYLETHDVKKMLGGRTIALKQFDDQNSTQQAAKVASDVAEADVLLVLGHYFSNSAIAASEVYQKKGIPAITASATADAVTSSNEWYFRTIPNNSFQGRFSAYYVKNILQQASTTIIFDQDNYGASLAQSYEDASRELGVKIQKKWGFDRESGDLEQQLRNITTELLMLRDPGAIFFATHEVEAVKMITTVKLPGTRYTMIGPDSFATPQFVQELQQSPQEQVQPGYYSDGIYVVSPFIADLASDQSLTFRQNFESVYNEEPGWEAACYYDAMAVAVEAIKRAEIEGTDLNLDRRKVREALVAFSDPSISIQGVTGDLYFDADRNVNRALHVGIYEGQRLRPAYTQYQVFAAVSENVPVSPTMIEQKKVLQLGGILMAPTQVVKTGIDVNEINYLDVRNSQYTFDGYLWFRFQGEWQVSDLTFPDALTPIILGPPILEATENNVTVRSFHLKATFNYKPVLKWYPLDRLLLPIRFQHTTRSNINLRYVADTAKLAAVSSKEKTLLNPVTGWQVEKISQFATIEPGPKVSYSRFNVILQMSRIGPGFLIKHLLPLGAIMMMLYWAYYIPIERPGIRFILILTVCIAAVLYELILRSYLQPNYFVLFEYAIFAVYALILIAIAVSIGGYVLHKRDAKTMLFVISLFGRVIHPLVLTLVGVAFVILYVLISHFDLTPFIVGK